MISEREYNEIVARVARMETLLQSNDAFAPPGAVTLEDMDLGPGVNYDIPDYNDLLNGGRQAQDFSGLDPSQYRNYWDDQQAQNYGYGPTDSAVADMLQRLQNLETLMAGGSNDTNQSNAQNAGGGVGDDGSTGTGLPPQATGVSLGLGTMAYQNASAVAITGGSVTGITNTTAATWVLTTLAMSASTSWTVTIPTISLTTVSSFNLTSSGGNILTDSGSSVGLSTSAKTTQVSGSTVTVAPSAASIINLGSTTSQVGFFNSSGTTKQTVTGSRGANAALASLLTALAGHNLITDSTTA